MSIVPLIVVVLAPAIAFAAIMTVGRRRRRLRSREDLARKIDLPKPIEPAKVDPFELPAEAREEVR